MTKKEKITQGKAKEAPAGGVVVGKRKGQTMIYDDASSGGFFVGKTHAEGGIDVLNKSTGQRLEVQGAEVIITAPAVADQTKREFEGEMLTNRQILSKINEKGGGVSFADGGDIPKSIKHSGVSYNYGGKLMKDREIIEMMNGGKSNVDLVKESKKGDHPARDLNNYNDVLDVDADGVVGAETGLFGNGGDLDFLNDVDRIFDEGGSTDLPIVSYLKVFNASSSLSSLEGRRFDSYFEFREEIEKVYRDLGRKVRTYTGFKVYDNNDSVLLIVSTAISDQKNTIKNFNPFTGNYENLKKVFQNERPVSFKKYNWDEWFSFKPSKSAKSEPKNPAPTSKSETKKITRVELTYSVGGGAEKDFVAFDYLDLIITLQNALDLGAYMVDVKIISKEQADLVGRYGLGVTRNPKLSYDINPYTITKKEFRKEVFEPFENKGFSADEFFDNTSKTKPKVKYLEDKNFDAIIGDITGLKSYILKRSAQSVDYIIFDIISNSEKKSFYIEFGIKRDVQDDRYFNIFGDIEALKKSIFATPDCLLYDWDDFFKFEPKEESKQEENPSRNFELEKKYLVQRINTLSSELDLKRPILRNEEVAFYQREINKFVSKLRIVSNDEMELKPIEARVNGVYKVKWGDYTKKYPETDVLSINGIKSELTFEEYMTVRTPEFKSFFGNWEQAYFDNTYSGVSKIINPKTKEPMPVFHGTNVLFTEWKTYDTNNAHYFAVKREMSDFFATSWESRSDKAGVDSKAIKALNPNTGTFLYRCFLDVRNPIDFSKFGVEKRPIKEFLLFLKINYNIGDYDFWTNLGNAKGFTSETRVYAWQIIRLWQNFTKYVKNFTTYDGYIFYEYIPDTPFGGLENASLSFCAFESNQIKFADAYEFNALSNDSRFDFGGKL